MAGPHKERAPREGLPIVVSAASGTGKTTVVARVLDLDEDAVLSISVTTRRPRGGERHGVEYHFVSDDEFDRMIADGELLEWALVHERRYGSPRLPAEQALAAGKNVYFDIDIQGGRQIEKKLPRTITIFLLPPSYEELKRRLHGRATESKEQISKRLDAARLEMKEGRSYRYTLVNENVENTARQIWEIVRTEMERTEQTPP